MEKKLKVLMLNGSPRKDGNIALGKKETGAPLPEEPRVWTNFTR